MVKTRNRLLEELYLKEVKLELIDASKKSRVARIHKAISTCVDLIPTTNRSQKR